MNGKKLKVVEYNLTFGTNTRFVNVLGCFRYIQNNNLYVVYSDVDSSYNIVYYGNSHVKENSILSMACKNSNDLEVIKEFIYKVTNNLDLSDFEMIALDQIDGLEIISSNKLEIKKEVLDRLVLLSIPKDTSDVVSNNVNALKNKKKVSFKSIFLLLILLFVIMVLGFLFLNFRNSLDDDGKSIICFKEYNHDTLNALVNEKKVFVFDIHDSLKSVNDSLSYKFGSEDDYLDFVNEGIYYKYIDDSTNSDWSLDDSKYLFTVTSSMNVGIDYNEPTNYEEVLSYYKLENYTCSEEFSG